MGVLPFEATRQPQTSGRPGEEETTTTPNPEVSYLKDKNTSFHKYPSIHTTLADSGSKGMNAMPAFDSFFLLF